jgi:hypothetical protein
MTLIAGLYSEIILAAGASMTSKDDSDTSLLHSLIDLLKRITNEDGLNRSRIRTVVWVPLTSNLRWVKAPGNVLLPAQATGLPKDSESHHFQNLSTTFDTTKKHPFRPCCCSPGSEPILIA